MVAAHSRTSSTPTSPDGRYGGEPSQVTRIVKPETRLEPAFPLTTSMGDMLSLMNSRRIALLQSRLDHHEVELHTLHRRVGLQQILIVRLMDTIITLRQRLNISEGTALRIGRALRVLVLQFTMIRATLTKNAAYRETLFRVAASNLWRSRKQILKILAILVTCHAGLRWSQFYLVQDLLTVTIFGTVAPRSVVRKLQTGGNILMLLGTAAVCRQFVNEISATFPFSLL